jgi:hypothetical protein
MKSRAVLQEMASLTPTSLLCMIFRSGASTRQVFLRSLSALQESDEVLFPVFAARKI